VTATYTTNRSLASLLQVSSSQSLSGLHRGSLSADEHLFISLPIALPASLNLAHRIRHTPHSEAAARVATDAVL